MKILGKGWCEGLTYETKNILLLKKQQKAKQEKSKLARIKIYERATEDYIDAMYYHQMYQSKACWKTLRDMSNGLKT